MPAKEEWALWCETAKRVREIEDAGANITKLARELIHCDVDPPLNWTSDLEQRLTKIEVMASHALGLVAHLKSRYCGVSDEQYIPEGHYIQEDADGERFVRKSP